MDKIDLMNAFQERFGNYRLLRETETAYILYRQDTVNGKNIRVGRLQLTAAGKMSGLHVSENVRGYVQLPTPSTVAGFVGRLLKATQILDSAAEAVREGKSVLLGKVAYGHQPWSNLIHVDAAGDFIEDLQNVTEDLRRWRPIPSVIWAFNKFKGPYRLEVTERRGPIEKFSILKLADFGEEHTIGSGAFLRNSVVRLSLKSPTYMDDIRLHTLSDDVRRFLTTLHFYQKELDSFGERRIYLDLTLEPNTSTGLYWCICADNGQLEGNPRYADISFQFSDVLKTEAVQPIKKITKEQNMETPIHPSVRAIMAATVCENPATVYFSHSGGVYKQLSTLEDYLALQNALLSSSESPSRPVDDGYEEDSDVEVLHRCDDDVGQGVYLSNDPYSGRSGKLPEIERGGTGRSFTIDLGNAVVEESSSFSTFAYKTRADARKVLLTLHNQTDAGAVQIFNDPTVSGQLERFLSYWESTPKSAKRTIKRKANDNK